MKQWVLWQINDIQINIEISDVKSALYNIHWDFVVDAIGKATGNIALVCKRFYAYVITRKFGWITTHLQILTTMPVASLQKKWLIKM